MNNEETIVRQSQNNSDEAEQNQRAETPSNNNNGKDVAMIATAVVAGEVIGDGITYAASETILNKGAGEQEPEEEAQTTEEPVVAATEEPEEEGQAEEQKPEEKVQTTEEPVVAVAEEPKKEEAVAKAEEDASTEPDYTNRNGADPVTPNPEAHTAEGETNSSGTNEVQILGVYEAQGEYGQTMQAAVLTNGEEIAAVFDIDGDGVADVLAVDENHNQQIDEGEVYDLSNNQIQMADYRQAYIAQQQEQMQQEYNTFAYNANDDQQDYNNNADLQYT